MSKVQGYVEAISAKATRTGGKAYGIMVDGTWYSAGFSDPGVEKGYQVRFTYTENGNFKNIDEGSLQAKKGSPKPTTHNGGFKGKKGGGGSSDYALKEAYWKEKERWDKQVTSNLIGFQNATTAAVNAVVGSVSCGALDIGKTKKTQLPLLIEFIGSVRDGLYEDFLAEKKRLVEGGDRGGQTEEPKQLEDEQQPLPAEEEDKSGSEGFPDESSTDDWDDDVPF